MCVVIPRFVAWRRGTTLPTAKSPSCGHHSDNWIFVEEARKAKSREHGDLFDSLVAVLDLQCAWLLLFFLRRDQSHCVLRVCAP